jgi:hypothetical protein
MFAEGDEGLKANGSACLSAPLACRGDDEKSPSEPRPEDDLDPLVLDWDEERFIVSEAVRSFCAQLDADP